MPTELSPNFFLLLALMVAPPLHAADPKTALAPEVPPGDAARRAALPMRPQAPVRPDSWLTAEDGRVTHNIRNTLDGKVMDSDPRAIRIITRNGAVTLRGIAKDRVERTQIGDVVRGTPGALTLNNALEVHEAQGTAKLSN